MPLHSRTVRFPLRPITGVLVGVGLFALASAACTTEPSGSSTSIGRATQALGGDGDPCTLDDAGTAGLQGNCNPGLWCNLQTNQCQSTYLAPGQAIPLPGGGSGCSDIAAASACMSSACNLAHTACGCTGGYDCAQNETCNAQFDCVSAGGADAGGDATSSDAAADDASASDATAENDAAAGDAALDAGAAADAAADGDASAHDATAEDGSASDATLGDPRATDASGVSQAGEPGSSASGEGTPSAEASGRGGDFSMGGGGCGVAPGQANALALVLGSLATVVGAWARRRRRAG